MHTILYSKHSRTCNLKTYFRMKWRVLSKDYLAYGSLNTVDKFLQHLNYYF